MDLAHIRAGIPALSSAIYLNTGTFGPLPAVVADEIRRAYGAVEQLGTFSAQGFWQMEQKASKPYGGRWPPCCMPVPTRWP